MWFRFALSKIPALDDIRAPSEDINLVMSSNGSYRAKGPAIIPIQNLTGGVNLFDKSESSRVRTLAESFKKPGSYFSRIIVDQDGEVIEGQHRLEALRMIGAREVPVYVIESIDKNVDNVALCEALQTSGLRSDHVNRLAEMLMELYADEKGNVKEIRNSYDAPSGFKKAWDIGLKELERQNS